MNFIYDSYEWIGVEVKCHSAMWLEDYLTWTGLWKILSLGESLKACSPTHTTGCVSSNDWPRTTWVLLLKGPTGCHWTTRDWPETQMFLQQQSVEHWPQPKPFHFLKILGFLKLRFMSECCKRTNILATGCGSHRSGGLEEKAPVMSSVFFGLACFMSRKWGFWMLCCCIFGTRGCACLEQIVRCVVGHIKSLDKC